MRGLEPSHTSSSVRGASLVEYLVALTFLGMLMVGMVAFFEPTSTQFHQEMADGVYVPYPNNFIEPSASPSAAPSP